MPQLTFPGTKPNKGRKFTIILVLAVFIVGLGLGTFSGLFYAELETRISRVLGIKTPRQAIEFDLFWDVWGLVQQKYVHRPVPKEQLFYGALSGMVASLKDPYSVFLDPELAEKFKQELAGEFEGIGAEIAIKKGRPTIIAPLPETPADKAGLKPGDKIYAIDGADTTDMTLMEAVSRIRGKGGTKVTLTVMRKTWSEPKDIEIIRQTIKIITVKWEMKERDIGYIRISHFDEDTLGVFEKAVSDLMKRGAKTVILDLRSNPGGYLETAVAISGFWIDKRLTVIEEFSKGNVREHYAYGHGELGDMRTIVLVNQGSASGSEIIAGALQDWNKALVIGETTFGKGSVQELDILKDGSAVKLTVAYWLTPKKRSIDEAGIVPDIEVELTEEDYEEDRDPQLNKAIELLSR